MRRLLSLCLLALMLVPAPGAMAAAEAATIRLSFAGDCTLGGHEGWMNYSRGTFKVMAQQQNDYGYFLRYAKTIFERDDLSLVNLEGVLSDSSAGRDRSKKWQFRGESAYVEVLSLGGVDMVTLGNNHSSDFGKAGLEATRAALDAAGILWCHSKRVSFFEKEGIKLAFLGFGEDDFRRNRAWIAQEIPRLKREEGVHAVILNYHGGKQYVQRHNQSQQEAMHFAIDCGADLVVGHHPHVLQGLETYKNRSIIYSLGNFCYGGNRKPRAVEYPTMILGASLRFEGGVYAGQQLTLHPYRISGTKPQNNYQPLPATPEQALAAMAIVQADTPFILAPFVAGEGAAQPYLPAQNPAAWLVKGD